MRGDTERGKKPRIGVIKVNVDATVLDGIGVGWGCVGRDDQGKMLWCAVTQRRGEMDATMAEALGMWHGLSEAVKHGHQDIEMESDCAVVVHDLQRKAKGRSDLFLVYEDILSICNSVRSLSFVFTRRNNNKVAHNLARFGPWSEGHRSWESVIPMEVLCMAERDANLIY
ncbi:uncharacterized protein LOC141627585 [Silene latifolia]|uniref:uncharacterized protein LOC141627585 n=1 Tax=Silene latifolia TaxID=37657 RepID=UPI003D77C2D6